MAIDFSALEAGLNSGKLIEPKKIFTTLNRDPKFKRPLDEQSEVLEKWFLNRNRKDNVFKMNTGSGKTFVGLLSLQSSLNESVYPAVYITPDRYLTSQVVEEAGFLGIDVTEDENDTAFLAGRAILVANVKKLFNGKSHFGVGIQGKQINIGAVVIDDAHACLATIGEQFSIFIPNDTELYRIIFKMFEQNLIQQNEYEKRSIETRGYGSFLQVPFWAWKDKASEVLKLFFEHKKEEGLDFSLPLIGGVLDLCRCLIATEGIHISPHCVPIDQIPSFNEAARRIYMTATLANDGILVSHFGADPTLIADPIKPSGVGVIGDRIIL